MTRTTLASIAVLVSMTVLPAADELPDAIEGWGKLGKAINEAGTIFECSVAVRTESGRLRAVKMHLEVPGTAKLFADHRVKLEKVEEDEQVLILGRTRDVEVRDDQSGRRGRDRQIFNVKALFLGDVPTPREYKDRKNPDMAWLGGKTSKPGTKGMWVRLEGGEYKAAVGRTPIIKREAADPKLVRRGVSIWVSSKRKKGKTPEEFRKDVKPFYEASQVILLDRGLLRTVYPLMF